MGIVVGICLCHVAKLAANDGHLLCHACLYFKLKSGRKSVTGISSIGHLIFLFVLTVRVYICIFKQALKMCIILIIIGLRLTVVDVFILVLLLIKINIINIVSV